MLNAPLTSVVKTKGVIPVNLEGALCLEELLLASGIVQGLEESDVDESNKAEIDATNALNKRNTDLAAFFWLKPDRSADMLHLKVVFRGMGIKFFRYDASRHTLQDTMFFARKSAGAYEVFCFAAAHPDIFRALLKDKPILVTPEARFPLLIIRMDENGKIVLEEVDQSSALEGVYQFACVSYL